MARYLKLAPLVFFLGACLLLLLGCGGSGSGDPRTNLDKAITALDGGDSDAAYRYAQTAIDALQGKAGDPDLLFQARLIRARALAATQPGKALEDFEVLWKDAPKVADGDAHDQMIRSLARTDAGKSKAIDLAVEGKQRFPQQADRFDRTLQQMSENATGADQAKLKSLGYIGGKKKEPADAKKDATESKPKE